MRKELDDSIKGANEASVTLMFTDLALADTMLERAETTQDEATRRRNIQHVTTACESVQHFMGKLRLSDAERDALSRKLAALQERLGDLQPQ